MKKNINRQARPTVAVTGAAMGADDDEPDSVA
jgi:hypothetical protein